MSKCADLKIDLGDIMKSQNYTLDDSAIAQIAKILQVAIISGTDIVDNLRQLNLHSDGGKLFVSEEYEKYFSENISRMLENVDQS